MKNSLPNCHKPCGNCPFRKDTLKGWLPNTIENILSSQSFVCHKTKDLHDRDKLQCAGHMLLRGEDNQFVRWANRLGLSLELSGREQIFDNAADCIKHHKHETIPHSSS
jgi:hypothetical protein